MTSHVEAKLNIENTLKKILACDGGGIRVLISV
jgi:hypothetical protein